MARLAAKRYGDRLGVAVSASVDVSSLTDAELQARLARCRAGSISRPNKYGDSKAKDRAPMERDTATCG